MAAVAGSLSGAGAAGLPKGLVIASWLLQIVVALILLQTLYFKFTGAPESKYIFTQMGMEPWGRIASGVVELIAAVLLLLPPTVVYGAILSAGVISGAIMSHLTKLGITIPNQDGTPGNDGGLLFGLALVVLVGSAVVLAVHRREIPIIGARL